MTCTRGRRFSSWRMNTPREISCPPSTLARPLPTIPPRLRRRPPSEPAMKPLTTFLALVLFAASAPAAGPFKDPALEKVIRAVLHMPSGDLTDEKLKNVHIVTDGS